MRPLFSGNAWEKLFEGNVRVLLEQDALVPFLRRQPWVDSRGRTIRTARFAEWILITHEPHPVFLTIVDVRYAGGDAESYAVPLAALPDPLGKSVAGTSPAAVLTVLTGARTGIVCDAFADDEACRELARLGERDVTFTTRRGSLRLLPEAGLDTRELDASPAQVHRLGNDHRQTAIVAGKRVLKLVRRLRETPHPEVEAVRALRMTGFERVPYLLGTVEYQTASDRSLTIAVSERRVSHQGNGWDYTIDELNRFFERVSLRSDEESEADDVDRQIQSFYDLRGIPPSAAVRDSIGIYLHDIALLGTRTADLHMALASSANPAIGAEPMTQADVRQLATSLQTRAREAFSRLEAQRKTFVPDINEKAEALLHRRAAIVDRLSRLERFSMAAQVIRCHNNYRLGQILRTEQDFVIVDFDRPVDVKVSPAAGPGFFKSVFRRFSAPPPDPRAAEGKGIALIDVATMLHSLSTATATELHAFLTTQQGDVVRIADWARRWEMWTSAAFLTAYLDRAAGLPFLPADDQQVRQLLAAFLLDATLDELRHYVDRWPERVAVLLQAALSLTAHLA